MIKVYKNHQRLQNYPNFYRNTALWNLQVIEMIVWSKNLMSYKKIKKIVIYTTYFTGFSHQKANLIIETISSLSGRLEKLGISVTL